jgi:hypothetical protein
MREFRISENRRMKAETYKTVLKQVGSLLILLGGIEFLPVVVH